MEKSGGTYMLRHHVNPLWLKIYYEICLPPVCKSQMILLEYVGCYNHFSQFRFKTFEINGHQFKWYFQFVDNNYSLQFIELEVKFTRIQLKWILFWVSVCLFKLALSPLLRGNDIKKYYSNNNLRVNPCKLKKLTLYMSHSNS